MMDIDIFLSRSLSVYAYNEASSERKLLVWFSRNRTEINKILMTVHRITSSEPESPEQTLRRSVYEIRCIGRIFFALCFALHFLRPDAMNEKSRRNASGVANFNNQISGMKQRQFYMRWATMLTFLQT